MEEWKKIDGYENYEVSNFGFVRNLNYNKIKILINREDNHGYLHIDLCKNSKVKTFKIHRLVAKSFIPNPENKSQVNHIDGNKKNNTVDNLEWNTAKENIIHSYKIGLNVSRKSVLQFDMNMNFIKEFTSITEAGREIGCCKSSISEICSGKKNHTKGFIFKYK